MVNIIRFANNNQLFVIYIDNCNETISYLYNRLISNFIIIYYLVNLILIYYHNSRVLSAVLSILSLFLKHKETRWKNNHKLFHCTFLVC